MLKTMVSLEALNQELFYRVLISLLAAISIYFLFLFLLSCNEEVNRIQEETKFYNTCDFILFERKLADIMIQLDLIDDFNYYLDRNENLLQIAAENYNRLPVFREICYRNGLKPRLEKNFAVL
jgi:hypothetical protein